MAFLDTLIGKMNEGELTSQGVQEEVDTFMFEVQKFSFKKNTGQHI